MTRKYLSKILKRAVARYGRPYQISEITTQWKARRYITMKMGERLAEEFTNVVLYGKEPTHIIMPRHHGETALKKAFEKAWHYEK